MPFRYCIELLEVYNGFLYIFFFLPFHFVSFCSTWSNLSSSLTKEEEALYSVVVANFGERQKQLLAENASLRQSLANLKARISEIVAGNQGSGGGDTEVDDPTLRLPIHLIRLNRLEDHLDRAELRSGEIISNELSRNESNLHIVETDIYDRSQSFKEERDRLSVKMEYYEETIERQAKMIERLAMGNGVANSSAAAASFSTSSVCCNCKTLDTSNLSFAASESGNIDESLLVN